MGDGALEITRRGEQTMYPPVEYSDWDDQFVADVPPELLWAGLGLAAVGVALLWWTRRSLRGLQPGRPTDVAGAPPRWEAWAVFGAAAAARAVQVFSHPLTEFESGTIGLFDGGVQTSIPALVAELAQLGYFPLHALASGLPVALAGTPLAGRVVPLLIGAATIALLTRVVARGVPPVARWGLYAAVLACPIGIYAHRLAVAYGWLLLGEVLLVLAADRFDRGDDRGGWAAVAGGAVLGLSGHFLGVFLCVPVGLLLISRLSRRGHARAMALRATVGLVGAALVAMPWLLIAFYTGLEEMGVLGQAELALAPIEPSPLVAALEHFRRIAELATVGPDLGALAAPLGVALLAGVLLGARSSREQAALAAGLLAVFWIAFNITSGFFFGPFVGRDYFHVRQHITVVALLALSLRAWALLRPPWTTAAPAAVGALTLFGAFTLESRPQQPDYRAAFADIAKDFRRGDSVVVLPSYTPWWVVRHYGHEAAADHDNEWLKRAMEEAPTPPRFLIPIRVPLEQQARSLRIERLWVLTLDDRTLGVYPHYDLAFAAEKLADLEADYDPAGPPRAATFITWQLFERRIARRPWPSPEFVVEPGVNDLYFLERADPPLSRQWASRALRDGAVISLPVPPGACGLSVRIDLDGDASGRQIQVRDDEGATTEWRAGARMILAAPPPKPVVSMRVRTNHGERVQLRKVFVSPVRCEDQGAGSAAP